MNQIEPVNRPEFVVDKLEPVATVEVQRELSMFERVVAMNWIRKLAILLGLVVAWELYTVLFDVEPLLFPSFTESFAVFVQAVFSGLLLERIGVTLYVLFLGYGAGLLLAAILLIFAVMSRIGSDFLSTMTAMFQPLPGISLLPLAMLWFGLGIPSLVFVTVHSVLWAVALSTHTGFMSVSQTLRMVGRNYGLPTIPYVFKILVPAALGPILTGMKVGWAFAWRTLIGAELVFGAASGKGGLGWMIYEKSNFLETSYVFAGLFAIILIGLLVENLVFRNVEISTLQKWGMQS